MELTAPDAPQPWSIAKTLGMSLLIFIVWNLAAVPVVFWFGYQGLLEADSDVYRADLLFYTSLSFFIISIPLYKVLLRGKSWSASMAWMRLDRLGERNAWLRWLTVVVLVTCAMELLNISLARPVPEFMQVAWQSLDNKFFVLFSVLVFAPLLEEVLFRGFLYNHLRETRLGFSGTLLITAAVFALTHLGQYGAYEMTQVFAAGLLFGLLREKTGNLWICIASHSLFNLIATVTLVTQL